MYLENITIMCFKLFENLLILISTPHVTYLHSFQEGEGGLFLPLFPPEIPTQKGPRKHTRNKYDIKKCRKFLEFSYCSLTHSSHLTLSTGRKWVCWACCGGDKRQCWLNPGDSGESACSAAELPKPDRRPPPWLQSSRPPVLPPASSPLKLPLGSKDPPPPPANSLAVSKNI